MQALRRAIGRKDVMFALLVFVLGGGWFGWRHVLRPAFGQTSVSPTELAQLQSLLDAGRYPEAITQADALAATPALMKYKAVAQMFAGQLAAALETVQTGLSAGASGPDAAGLLAARALVLLAHEYQQVPEASQAATQAHGLVGQDPEAQVLASVAMGACLRGQLDTASDPQAILATAAQIRQVLTPLLQQVSACPQSDWQSKLWRRGLAVLADAGFLGAQAGDAGAELDAMTLLQQHCPQDAWACYLSIPERARQAAMQPAAPGGVVDDHARIAMYTAVGYLYTQVGDRAHCDSLFRKAIGCYIQALNTTGDWAGEQSMAFTPAGARKAVGREFYDYRNRLERLAKYSGDWWGIRVARGEVTLEQALAVCDYQIFRALVRFKGDRQTHPVLIAMQEHLRPDFIQTLAAWLEANPYEPQVAWEEERAAVLKQVGDDQVAVNDVFQRMSAFYGPGVPLDLAGAERVLRDGLATEPVLLASRVKLRSRLADILMQQKRYTEVLALLDANDQDMQQGDPYLGTMCPCRMLGAFRCKYQALLATGRRAEAMAFAESLADDATQTDDVRLVMLMELAMAYLPKQIDAAGEIYTRMQNYTLTDPNYERMRQALLEAVSRAIEQVRRMDRDVP